VKSTQLGLSLVLAAAASLVVADEPSVNVTLAELAADTHADLTYLADRRQIEDLEIAYATAHNTTNADIYRRVFTEDAQMVTPTGAVALDGMQKILASVDTDRERFNPDAKPGAEVFGNMRHIITNVVINVHGKTADSTCYLLNTAYNAKQKKTEILAMGRYDDQLVKNNGEWRIKRRMIITDWGNDELAQVLGVGPYTPQKYR
jgi:hypothetical protein